MNTMDTVTVNPPNLDPAVMKYFSDPPTARAIVDEGDFSRARAQLVAAAQLAVSKDDKTGNRWVPGLSIVIVRPVNGILQAEYFPYGTKRVDRDAAEPVTADTRFACASLSKPVSTSLLVAASPDNFTPPNWDAPVRRAGATKPLDFYHNAQSHEQELARHWLSHLSGMPGHAGDLIEDMNPDMRRDELLGRIQQFQTGIVPREYNYTNMGFTMGCLGAAWELGSDDWESFAQTQLNVIGMTHSTYKFVSAYHDTSDRAYPHQGQPDSSQLLKVVKEGWQWHVVPEADERKPARQAPAGSLLSSARDLGQFLNVHLADKFGHEFPPRNLTPLEKLKNYSLGWNVTNNTATFPAWARNAVSFNHSGAFSLGAGTFLRFDPGIGAGIAVLSNGEPTGVPEALGILYFKTLYGDPMPPGCDFATLFANARAGYMYQLYEDKIANNEKYRSAPRIPIPARIPNGQVFRGHSDYFGCDFTIERTKPSSPNDTGLYLTMGATKEGPPFWRFQLQCIQDSQPVSTFVYQTKGENEVGWSPLRFGWMGDRINRIVLDWLEHQGPGLGTITAR